MHLKRDELEKICTELLHDFDDILNWKWDERFDALLAEFPSENIDAVQKVLDEHMTRTWDKKSIRKAPGAIRDQCGIFCDLRSSQLLFSSDPAGNVLVFAAWWPWGDGNRVSLRLASPDPDAPPPEKKGIFSRIKGLFG